MSLEVRLGKSQPQVSQALRRLMGRGEVLRDANTRPFMWSAAPRREVNADAGAQGERAERLRRELPHIERSEDRHQGLSDPMG
jgi:hypothetical protein